VKKGMQHNPKIFYGWFVIGGLFVVAFVSPMGRYILTALFPFIMRDPGWSRQAIGLAFTIHLWAYAFFAIFAGRLIDGIGGRITIFIGGLLMLVGLAVLSAVQQIWQLYLVFGILLAAALSMAHFAPITVLVRKWFIKKAGLATGLVTIGMVSGFAVLSPIISRLSAYMGWRSACLICAMGFGTIIMLTAGLIIRKTPESMGLHPDGEASSDSERASSTVSDISDLPREPLSSTTGEALGDRNFWYFFTAYSVTGIPMQGLLGHMIIWGVDLGFPTANSGMIMAALTIPSIPVRILAGWLGDRFGKKRVLIFFNLYAVAIWFSSWFFIKDTSSFLVFVILLGFAYSAPFSLYTPLLGDIFGRAIVGTLMGLVTLGHGIIGGIGPYVWGWIADRTSSYLWNCPISAACYLIVVISIFLLRAPARGSSA
jgi:MFS family permease